MEQHPIPRQITSFEFKLIGFMTLKQFLYLVIFTPLGWVVYKLIPVPIARELVGVIVGAVGILFAFMPVNDRPLDFFIKTLIKRLLSPTQYTFQKANKPVYFLENLYYLSDPHKVFTHIESQEKLAAYLTKVKKTSPPDALRNKHRATVAHALQNTVAQPVVNQKIAPIAAAVPQPQPQQGASQTQIPAVQTAQTSTQPLLVAPVIAPQTPQKQDGHKQPFLIGLAKNHKNVPIPNILVYIKDSHGATLRILKSNPHGVFATYNALPPQTYQFTFADPKGEHIFDTMNVGIKDSGNKPLEVVSKELL